MTATAGGDVTAPGTTLPGPSGRAALVATLGLRGDFVATLRELREHYGPVVGLRLPPLPGVPRVFVHASEPAAVREILTDTRRFTKGSPVFAEVARSIGDGLLTSEGERWVAQRRTLQPLFTRRRIADYTDAFLDATQAVSDDWVGRGSVELVEEMEKLTLGSVSRALFGTDVTADVAPIVAATDEMSRITVRRGLAPVRAPRWLPTSEVRRLRHLETDLRDRTRQLVAQAAAQPRAHEDLVTRLLGVRDPETGEQLDDEEILSQALVFLLAGYDTTSTALAFTPHELGARPDLQQAVRDEIAEVVGDETPGPEDAARLDLTRRCLLEAMRLHPPAYVTGRLATAATTVAGFAVPAGAVVTTVFALLHRDPDRWPDPERFDPDRFLPDAVRARDHYTYLPFGGGPRSCIGEHFAMLEAALALAVLLRRWRVTTDAGAVPMRYGITQRADAPIRARLAAV